MLIYFSPESRRDVVRRLVTQHLDPAGYLLLGHAETVHDLKGELRAVGPSICSPAGARGDGGAMREPADAGERTDPRARGRRLGARAPGPDRAPDLEPGFEVVCAHDPIIAQQKMERFRPDVVILDLEMPRMDGLTFLRKLMAEDPLPVVVCSAHTGKGTDAALRALEEGAVDVLAKPRLGVKDFLWESSLLFLDAVRAAAEAGRGREVGAQEAHGRRCRARPSPAAGAGAGGPRPRTSWSPSAPRPAAPRRCARSWKPCRADAPGIVVVQHMPEGFTRAFAERLDRICAIEVKEAEAGDRVRAGPRADRAGRPAPACPSRAAAATSSS